MVCFHHRIQHHPLKQFTMKNLLLILTCALSTSLFAQGNLQFNQVITQNYSITENAYNSISNSNTSLTVPSGKVWKIESVIFKTYSANNTYDPNCFLMINGFNVLFETGSSYGNDSGGALNHQPIWLKAGNQIGFSMKNTCATNCLQSMDGFISIIEFNIIP